MSKLIFRDSGALFSPSLLKLLGKAHFEYRRLRHNKSFNFRNSPSRVIALSLLLSIGIGKPLVPHHYLRNL